MCVCITLRCRKSDITRQLRELGQSLPRPLAILVVSAHWETEKFTITSHESPGLLYDYFGFPPAAYELEYDAPGHPLLAKRVR